MSDSSNQGHSPAFGASIGGNAIVQAGFVVDDLDDAITRWVSLGVGPFFKIPHLEIDNINYLGEEIKADVSIALAHAGGIQLELMFQHDDTLGVWNNPIYPMTGVHHLAFMVDDYDAAIKEMEAQGIPAIQTIHTRGVHTAYLDGMEKYGHLLEIQERKPALVALNDAVTEASLNWDGTESVRSFAW